jgi:hypothetical protein
MTTNNGGAPADGGNDNVELPEMPQDTAGDGGENNGSGDGGERRQLSSDEYEARDRQKTEALRQARQSERRYRTEMDDFRKELATLKGAGKGAGPDGEDIEIPDPTADPMAALQALRKLAGQFTQQQRQTSQMTEKQQAEARVVNKIISNVQEHEADFRLDQPDYDEGVAHLRASLKSELEDRGYKGNALTTAVTRELLRIAHEAGKNEQDPAEAYWKLSIRRGYQAKNGARQIESMKNGQKSSTNIPRGGGRNSNFSHDHLMNAKGEDFDKAWKIYEQQAKGGRA